MGKRSLRQLTQREREIVVLIGRHRLSYKAAARKLSNLRDDGHGISPHTVREYARRIRDKIESDLAPRDALTELFWARPGDFNDEAA